MKRKIKSGVFVLLTIILSFTLVSCGGVVSEKELWESATYQNDTTLGSGEKTLILEVTAEEKTVTFAVKTNQNTVGAALLEHELIAGEKSEYGLYLKKVNGITADYNVDRSYWAFYIDGEYALSGVDTTEITEGVTYKLERTK